MCKYYEVHDEHNFDISEFYTKKQYDFDISVLNDSYKDDFEAVLNWNKNDFYNNISDFNFQNFAYSRKSIRTFTGEKIDKKTIENVISLANTAPSVCNRQASKVYLIEDKNRINEILKVQGGFSGFSNDVSQLLILTNDRKFYYTIGERNQFYIDGGIYLMNLLYSLHYYEIANCPANWGKTIDDEKQLNRVITLPESEKIICIIPIGIAADEFKTTLSFRRPVNENFYTL